MGCPNESVWIPMEAAGRWANRTDPIIEEAVWVRLDVATKVTERLIAQAVTGDPGLLLGIEQPAWVRFAYRALRLDAYLWRMFTAPFRRLNASPGFPG